MREFYTDPITGEAMVKEVGEQTVKQMGVKDTELIASILQRSETFYPEQYEAVCKEYSKSSANVPYYNFLRARRIINCCFGENDRQPDIDEFGNYHFEPVKCPRIAECKYFRIICQPKFNSSLSDREKEVMKLYFEHVKTEDIADRLFLSIHTVNNHRRNSLQKLQLHSLEEFQDYAHKNQLFKNQP
jgi:DNA-binding CsgD family transcriptional regulator